MKVVRINALRVRLENSYHYLQEGDVRLPVQLDIGAIKVLTNAFNVIEEVILPFLAKPVI